MRGMYEEDGTLSEDEKRLAYISALIDGTDEVDLHERASSYAVSAGREEANERDYCNAVRDMLDALRASP